MPHPPLGRRLRRLWNAGLRARSGLRLHAENVSPEVRNDLFLAHLSVYIFFSRFTAGRRTLDLGCGAGYGSDHLLRSGAREVVGIDLDPRNVRYAQRRWQSPALTYRVADAEALPDDLGMFDAVVTSNVLEHLHDVDRGLAGIRRRLSAAGTLGVVVPPITDEASLRACAANEFHHSNLYIGEWLEKLGGLFGPVRTFRHLPPPGTEPDFGDPFPSALDPEAFLFLEVAPGDLGREPTLGAVFVCGGE
jgi:SAM-dependent methyltransferase